MEKLNIEQTTRNGDRNFAIAAELSIHQFGDGKVRRAEAITYVKKATDGAITLAATDDSRLVGWVNQTAKPGMIRFNPGALLAPSNVHHARVTSKLIETALDFTDNKHDERVASLLYDQGIHSSNPVRDKDRYAFGFVLPPKRYALRDEVGVMAVADARRVTSQREEQKFTTIKEMMQYFQDEFDGVVLSKSSLAAVVRDLLDIPEGLKLDEHRITHHLAAQNHHFSLLHPNRVRSYTISGVMLNQGALRHEMRRMQYFIDAYHDLEVLKEQRAVVIDRPPAVEPTKIVVVDREEPSLEQPTDHARSSEVRNARELAATLEQNRLQIAFDNVRNQLRAAANTGAMDTHSMLNYMERIKDAKERNLVETLKGIKGELGNLYLGESNNFK